MRDEKGDHFSLGEPVRTDLSEMDVILLRQDPPFDMNYITTTHILERIHPKTLVVNDPAWVRNSPEKIFVTEFADLMPETLITKDPQEVAAFRREFGDIIVKPLYGNGGAGIFHLHEADRNLASLLEMFGQMFREPYIVQRYLKDVRKGDKRIILIDGEPVGAINRVPAEHDSRSNMHVGGRAEKTELTSARARDLRGDRPVADASAASSSSASTSSATRACRSYSGGPSTAVVWPGATPTSDSIRSSRWSTFSDSTAPVRVCLPSAAGKRNRAGGRLCLRGRERWAVGGRYCPA